MQLEHIQVLISDLAGSPGSSSRPPMMLDRLDELMVRKNQKTTIVFPDQIDVLREICSRIDQEPDGRTAWDMVASVEMTGVFAKSSELQELRHAVASNILSSTVAYLNVSSGDVASGVLVEIADRVFMATAAHCIPARPSERLSFVGRDATKFDANKPIVDSFGKDKDYELRDIGYIELRRDFVERLGKSAVPMSRIFPCGPGQDNHLTLVAGYPIDEIGTTKEGPGKETRKFTMECWANKTLPAAQWRSLEKSRREPDENLDVFIPRPVYEDFVSTGAPLQKAGVLSKPTGMSGGGYWQPNFKLKGNVWTPDHYCVIAIQSHWWASTTGTGRYLQATQIIHWLRLLWQTRPELRKLLDDSFSEENLSSE